MTPVESPDRAEYEMDDFGLFWPIQAAFVVGEPLCDVGTPSSALISLFRVFQ